MTLSVNGEFDIANPESKARFMVGNNPRRSWEIQGTFNFSGLDRSERARRRMIDEGLLFRSILDARTVRK